ncbi:LOG family protein, partial [Candidatus Latescibacterota bacterium]
DARQVGSALARAGWVVVNGGYGGVMEASALGAKEAGGVTIGVTTGTFAARGITANPHIDTEITVPTYSERLIKLTNMADGYVIMRGGSGTLAEFFHVWELVKNQSLSLRPIVLCGTHWRRIMGCLEAELADEAAFARFQHLLAYADDPGEVTTIFRRYFRE